MATTHAPTPTPSPAAAALPPAESIVRNPFVSAKLYPIKGNERAYVIDRRSFASEQVVGQPIPPTELRENYGKDGLSYYQSGRTAAQEVAGVASKYCRDQGTLSLLDWGCASGRVLRHLPGFLPKSKC